MWSDKLQCHWNKWDIYAENELRLWVIDGDCPDMRATCDMAEAICPNVHTIHVVSGITYINRYTKVKKTWRAS